MQSKVHKENTWNIENLKVVLANIWPGKRILRKDGLRWMLSTNTYSILTEY